MSTRREPCNFQEDLAPAASNFTVSTSVMSTADTASTASTAGAAGAEWYWDPLYREWCRVSREYQCYISTSGRQISPDEARARPPGQQLIAQAAGNYPNSGNQLANVAQSSSTAGGYTQGVQMTRSSNVAAMRDPSTGVTQYVATSGGVQSVWQEGPAPAITESAAFSRGLQATKKFKGTPQPYEQLDKRYKVREGNRAAFFQLGRVFMVLYAEPMGQSSARTDITYDSRYGEAFHVKPRRFIVVTPGETSCTAVAIWTYDNQGVAKPRVRKSDHAIVYTGQFPPDPRQFPTADERAARGEGPMKPQKIRVIPDDHGEQLSVMSRINFAKVYTIEHNVKLEHASPAQAGAIRDTVLRMRTQDPAQASAPAAASAQAVASSSSARTGRVARDSVMSTGSSSGSYRRASMTTNSSRQSRHSGRSRDADSEQGDVPDVAEEDSDDDNDEDDDDDDDDDDRG